MSILRDIMNESRGVVNDILGHSGQLKNGSTGELVPATVIINTDVKLYQDGIFAALLTTGVFDRTECDPKLMDTFIDDESGIDYILEAVKSETPSKLEFILGVD